MAMKGWISPSHRYECHMSDRLRRDWSNSCYNMRAFILMRENVEIYYPDVWPQNQLGSSLGHRVSRYELYVESHRSFKI